MIGAGASVVSWFGIFLVLLKFVFQAGGAKKSFDLFVASLTKLMDRHHAHIDNVEKHHERVEDLLGRIENGRPARPVSGSHATVAGLETTPPSQ